MPTPTQRHTSSRVRRHRSQLALTKTPATVCVNCGSAKKPHTACSVCGIYKGRKVLATKSDVTVKRQEKRKKQEDKEKQKMKELKNK